MPSLGRAAALGLVAAVLAGVCITSRPAPTCPHDAAACYFSDGYSSARARFRAAALDANATLHKLTVNALHDLTIDVAVLPAALQEARHHCTGTPITILARHRPDQRIAIR